jgi:hypothetical protein
MRREGLLRHNRLENGTLVDEVWYGLLRAEWTDQAPRQVLFSRKTGHERPLATN